MATAANIHRLRLALAADGSREGGGGGGSRLDIVELRFQNCRNLARGRVTFRVELLQSVDRNLPALEGRNAFGCGPCRCQRRYRRDAGCYRGAADRLLVE